MHNEINLSIGHLAEFTCRTGSIDSRFTGLDRGQQGAIIHRRLQKERKKNEGGKNYTAEKALSKAIERNGICYVISGRADGICRKNGKVRVDEIKTISEPLESLNEHTHPEHLAQALCYCYILCTAEKLEEIFVQLVYYNIDTDEQKFIDLNFTAKEVQHAVENMLDEYSRFAKRSLTWADKRQVSLRNLNFPFEQYRNGQRQMAIGIYNTCKNEEKLFCCAPTGTGKTMSALFPAMKAMGEGFGERIFYLTAKNTSAKSAQDALKLLCNNKDMDFLSISITAKDKICFLDERACLPEMCPYANGYYNRIKDALYNVLENEKDIARETVENYAKKHMVCPYELSLDISLWCDCIICDYNYVFDPVVYLRRFFDGGGGDNIFLIDESHNLLERGRDMYSAGLAKSDFVALKKALPANYKKMHKAITGVNAVFLKLGKKCNEQDVKVICQKETIEEITLPLENFMAASRDFLENNKGNEFEQSVLNVYFEALFYQKIESFYAGNYVSLIEKGKDLKIRQQCLDPARFLHESLNMARASVLFSATLLPLTYYRRVLGGLAPADMQILEAAGPENEEGSDEDELGGEAIKTVKPKKDKKSEKGKLLNLESPFKQENLGLYIADGISTKYNDRQLSMEKLAEIVYKMVQSKQGNYMVYFPSYSYMESVYTLFAEKYPEINCKCQQSGMDEEEREAFLQMFAAENEESLLGFCVMGGVFAEGIDLAGERLIGTAVVGVGLPQIGPVPDSIKEYYNSQNLNGFDFAYRYPGMNKVLQAGGRVIRTEQDKGLLVLIDSRFTTDSYLRLFPKHWSHWKRVSSTGIANELANFWENI